MISEISFETESADNKKQDRIFTTENYLIYNNLGLNINKQKHIFLINNKYQKYQISLLELTNSTKHLKTSYLSFWVILNVNINILEM